MEYREFINKVKEQVSEQIRELVKGDVKIELHQVTKNNSVVLDGISIVEDEMNIAPTIYLNDFFSEFQMGEDISGIAEKVVSIYFENRIEESIDITFFTDFMLAKERIVCKLVNYEKNQKLLDDMPHIRFLDLAVVYYCLVSTNEIGNATILIMNNHMKIWEVNKEEIHRQAILNTKRLLGFELKNMIDLMNDILIEDLNICQKDQIEEITNPECDRIPMYVLTNKSKINGASCLLYSELLQAFANQVNKDFYILPSSIHEVILVPVSQEYSRGELVEMVIDVNTTQVQEEEILSNNVYFYSQSNQTITM